MVRSFLIARDLVIRSPKLLDRTRPRKIRGPRLLDRTQPRKIWGPMLLHRTRHRKILRPRLRDRTTPRKIRGPEPLGRTTPHKIRGPRPLTYRKHSKIRGRSGHRGAERTLFLEGKIIPKGPPRKLREHGFWKVKLSRKGALTATMNIIAAYIITYYTLHYLPLTTC